MILSVRQEKGCGSTLHSSILNQNISVNSKTSPSWIEFSPWEVYSVRETIYLMNERIKKPLND